MSASIYYLSLFLVTEDSNSLTSSPLLVDSGDLVRKYLCGTVAFNVPDRERDTKQLWDDNWKEKPKN